MNTKRIIGIAILVLALAAAAGGVLLWRRGYFAAARYAFIESQTPKTLVVASPAFADGATIPASHTCDGESLSVPLTWGDPPTSTQSFALVSEDLDVSPNGWVHWVMYNIPLAKKTLSEGQPADDVLPSGALQGKNGPGQSGYQGSCPPSGTHRYSFKVYALDSVLKLNPGATKAELFEAMQGHLLAYGETIGSYTRK